MTAQPSTSWAASWTDALTALELDVAAVEDMLEHLHEDADRTPSIAERGFAQLDPARLGPLPVDQADRARAVLARQQAVAGALVVAMTANRRQQRLAASLSQRSSSVPVYVDTAV